MTKNESKLLSIQGIAKASAFCLLLSAFSVNAALPFLPKFWYTETTLQFSIPYLRYPDNRF